MTTLYPQIYDRGYSLVYVINGKEYSSDKLSIEQGKEINKTVDKISFGIFWAKLMENKDNLKTAIIKIYLPDKFESFH
jgi:hypothetical protein